MARRKADAAIATQDAAGEHSQVEELREAGDEAERPKIPNPFTFINDTAAGVRVAYGRDPYQAEIRFKDGKPSEAVRQIMKEAGFRWNPPFEAWTRPVEYNTRAQDRIVAERTARAVTKLVCEEKGIEPSQQDMPAF